MCLASTSHNQTVSPRNTCPQKCQCSSPRSRMYYGIMACFILLDVHLIGGMADFFTTKVIAHTCSDRSCKLH
ncbi:hypothetical protein BDR04DRAFT_346516 [Suillus decipiens]|nr:hypothetical protein BDR04DRAFT_346516 [Suillus decipiens]